MSRKLSRRDVLALGAVVLVVVSGLGLGIWKLVQPHAAAPHGLQARLYSCGGLRFDPNARPSPSAPVPAQASSLLSQTTARLPDALPQSGWRTTWASDVAIYFVAPSHLTLAPYVFVRVLQDRTSGNWSIVSYGDCEPAVPPVVEDSGFGLPPWAATPGAATAASETIAVLVGTSDCETTSFLGPTIWYTSSTVVVTFWERSRSSLTSGEACDAVLLTKPYELRLAEPIGSRTLKAGPASAIHDPQL